MRKARVITIGRKKGVYNGGSATGVGAARVQHSRNWLPQGSVRGAIPPRSMPLLLTSAAGTLPLPRPPLLMILLVKLLMSTRSKPPRNPYSTPQLLPAWSAARAERPPRMVLAMLMSATQTAAPPCPPRAGASLAAWLTASMWRWGWLGRHCSGIGVVWCSPSHPQRTPSWEESRGPPPTGNSNTTQITKRQCSQNSHQQLIHFSKRMSRSMIRSRACQRQVK